MKSESVYEVEIITIKGKNGSYKHIKKDKVGNLLSWDIVYDDRIVSKSERIAMKDY